MNGSSLPALAAASSDYCGRILNLRYRLGSRLIKGELGELYQAQDFIRQQRCSLKLVRSSQGSLFAQQRLPHEAKILSRLCHRNIVRGAEFNWDIEGNLFLELEPLFGQSLQALLEETGTLPLGRTLEILHAVGTALQYLHDLGIVHQDLKPSSIFLHNERSADGEVLEVIKLLDFGLARQISPKSFGAEHDRRPDSRAGSAYMAPEMLRYSGDEVDARSDEWSLAVLAYRMLTGRLPFRASEPGMPITRVRETDPQPLAEVMPELPSHVALAIDKALSRDPEQRHAQVQDFLCALDGQASQRTLESDMSELLRDVMEPAQTLAGETETEIEIKGEVDALGAEGKTRQYPLLVLPALLRSAAGEEPAQPALPQPVQSARSEKARPGSYGWLWLAGCFMLLGTALGARVVLQRLTFESAPALAAPAAAAPAGAGREKSERSLDATPAQPAAQAQAPTEVEPAPSQLFTGSRLPHSPRRYRKSHPAPAAAEAAVARAGSSSAAGAQAQLDEAQLEYMEGNYKKAIAMATAMQNRAPDRAFRIIGSSACYLRDLTLVSAAYGQLVDDDAAQRFVRHVCKINGIEMTTPQTPAFR